MLRSDIINTLIKNFSYKTYLEIGVRDKKQNFNKINICDKEGVDPNSLAEAEHIMTSDEFFNKNNKKFDIIFIDGLHIKDQFIRDVENSLKFLNDGGIIVCHDCLPNSFEEQDGGPYPPRAWTGDVWKGIAYFRMNRPDMEINVVDTDYGCGIIRSGKQNLYINKYNQEIDYSFYVQHKNELMNVISVNEFIRVYKK